MRATVTDVSRDAVSENTASQSPVSAIAGAPQASGVDLHYLVRLSLDRDTLLVDGRQVPLVPGMMVEAEIMTGRRRIVEFMLSPLSKTASEAGRER